MKPSSPIIGTSGLLRAATSVSILAWHGSSNLPRAPPANGQIKPVSSLKLLRSSNKKGKWRGRALGFGGGMADTAVDPRDKMRSRDVNRVARGQQSPRPAHLPGEVSDAPPDEAVDDVLQVGTAPADFRFPFTNQTRHCYARYLEYHQYQYDSTFSMSSKFDL